MKKWLFGVLAISLFAVAVWTFVLRPVSDDEPENFSRNALSSRHRIAAIPEMTTTAPTETPEIFSLPIDPKQTQVMIDDQAISLKDGSAATDDREVKISQMFIPDNATFSQGGALMVLTVKMKQGGKQYLAIKFPDDRPAASVPLDDGTDWHVNSVAMNHGVLTVTYADTAAGFTKYKEFDQVTDASGFHLKPIEEKPSPI